MEVTNHLRNLQRRQTQDFSYTLISAKSMHLFIPPLPSLFGYLHLEKVEVGKEERARRRKMKRERREEEEEERGGGRRGGGGRGRRRRKMKRRKRQEEKA